MFSLPNPAVVVLLNHFKFRQCVTWRVEGEPPQVSIIGGSNTLSRERALGVIEVYAALRGETIDDDHPALVLAGACVSDPKPQLF